MDDDDLVEKYGAAFLRLGNIVDRIKNEMGHDAFILIIQPHALVVKSLFAAHDLPCTADGDALSFKDDISKEEIEVN